MRKEGESPRLRRRRWVANTAGAAVLLVPAGLIDVGFDSIGSRIKAKDVAVSVYPVNTTELRAAEDTSRRFRKQVAKEVKSGRYEVAQQLLDSPENQAVIKVVENQALDLREQLKKQDAEYASRIGLGWRFVRDGIAIAVGSVGGVVWAWLRKPKEPEASQQNDILGSA